MSETPVHRRLPALSNPRVQRTRARVMAIARDLLPEVGPIGLLHLLMSECSARVPECPWFLPLGLRRLLQFLAEQKQSLKEAAQGQRATRSHVCSIPNSGDRRPTN